MQLIKPPMFTDQLEVVQKIREKIIGNKNKFFRENLEAQVPKDVKPYFSLTKRKGEQKGRKLQKPTCFSFHTFIKEASLVYVPCGCCIKMSTCPPLWIAVVWLPPWSRTALGSAVPTAAKTPFTRPPRRRESSLRQDVCLGKKKKLGLGSSVSMRV